MCENCVDSAGNMKSPLGIRVFLGEISAEGFPRIRNKVKPNMNRVQLRALSNPKYILLAQLTESSIYLLTTSLTPTPLQLVRLQPHVPEPNLKLCSSNEYLDQFLHPSRGHVPHVSF